VEWFFFLECFRGELLSKNKMQLLDLTSHLWPTLIKLPLMSIIRDHYDVLVKHFKPPLSFFGEIIFGSWNIWIVTMVILSMPNLLWVCIINHFIFFHFLFFRSFFTYILTNIMLYIFLCWHWVLFIAGCVYCSQIMWQHLQLWKGENNVCH